MAGKRRKAGCMINVAGLILIAVLAYAGYHFGKELFQKEIPFEEVAITEEELSGKYYYTRLEKEEQRVYKELLQGIRKESQEIYVHDGDAKSVNEIFGKILRDCPELFWCSGTAKTRAEGTYSVFLCDYTYRGEERTRRQAEIEKAAQECLSGLSEEQTEYEKIKYIYEYMINTTDYNEKAPDHQNLYSALVNRQSVCAGYARATQYLLEQAGIRAAFVTGTVKSGGEKPRSHAWNLVQCDGEYYYVDTTWGDPVFAKGEDIPEEMKTITYDYLCCSEAELSQTHTADEGTDLPPCTSERYNYYRMQNRYYETYAREQIVSAMQEDIREEKQISAFKFASEEEYRKAEEDFKERTASEGAEYLGQYRQVSEVEYYLIMEQSLRKVSVYWK